MAAPHSRSPPLCSLLRSGGSAPKRSLTQRRRRWPIRPLRGTPRRRPSSPSTSAQHPSMNDKRERLVRSNHDVAMNSKMVIFQVHRISKNNKEEVLSKAENDLAVVVNQYIGKYRNMLKLQDSVDFAGLVLYCLAEINDSLLELSDKSVEPLQINVLARAER